MTALAISHEGTKTQRSSSVCLPLVTLRLCASSLYIMSLMLFSVPAQLPGRKIAFAHRGYNRDRSVFIGETLCVGHRFEDWQSRGHPVASRIPVTISDVIGAAITAQGGDSLAGQLLGLGNAVSDNRVDGNQIQPITRRSG